MSESAFQIWQQQSQILASKRCQDFQQIAFDFFFLNNYTTHKIE